MTVAEIGAIQDIVVPRSLAKNEFFVREAEPCFELALVDSGVMRHFHWEQDEEITDWIALPGTFSGSFESFSTGLPSNESIQAIEPTELYCIPRASWQRLCEDIPMLKERWSRAAEKKYLNVKEQLSHFISKTAEQRYDILCQKHPELIERVPQKYIASILGIDIRHLSRIRKAKKLL